MNYWHLVAVTVLLLFALAFGYVEGRKRGVVVENRRVFYLFNQAFAQISSGALSWVYAAVKDPKAEALAWRGTYVGTEALEAAKEQVERAEAHLLAAVGAWERAWSDAASSATAQRQLEHDLRGCYLALLAAKERLRRTA